jgi:hypothetical protein
VDVDFSASSSMWPTQRRRMKKSTPTSTPPGSIPADLPVHSPAGRLRLHERGAGHGAGGHHPTGAGEVEPLPDDRELGVDGLGGRAVASPPYDRPPCLSHFATG